MVASMVEPKDELKAGQWVASTVDDLGAIWVAPMVVHWVYCSVDQSVENRVVCLVAEMEFETVPQKGFQLANEMDYD